MLAAILAAVGHWLVIFALGYGNRTTVATYRLIITAALLKEQARCLLIWEFLKELECAKSI